MPPANRQVNMRFTSELLDEVDRLADGEVRGNRSMMIERLCIEALAIRRRAQSEVAPDAAPGEQA